MNAACPRAASARTLTRMPARSLGRTLPLSLTLALVLSACGLLRETPREARSPAPVPAAETRADSTITRFAQEQRRRAEQAEADGRWADAAWAWEVLQVLQPADAQTVARLDAARRQITVLSRQHREQALAAEQRRDHDAAQREWLQVLALDPHDAEAAAALREIERSRSARSRRGRFLRPAPPRGPVRSGASPNPGAEQAPNTR